MICVHMRNKPLIARGRDATDHFVGHGSFYRRDRAAGFARLRAFNKARRMARPTIPDGLS